MDGIPLEIVELLFRANKKLFLALLNKCLNEGVFPSQWKVADLIFFNKVGKERGLASSYHRICLLPAGSKVLDKLVTNRLVFHSQSHGYMNQNHFGFTPGMGTEDAPHKLRKAIENCHSRDNDRCLVMLDVKRAFNSLWWPSIFIGLSNLRCPKNFFHLLRSFLSERKVVYRTEISSLEWECNVGCPQVSNSGPFFWSVIANTLLDLDLGECVKIIAYANDFGLLIEAPNAYQYSRSNVSLAKICTMGCRTEVEFQC